MDRPENFGYLVAAAKELEKQRSIYFLENNSVTLLERQRSPFLRPADNPKLSSVATHQDASRLQPPPPPPPAVAAAIRQEPSPMEIRQLVTGLWGNTGGTSRSAEPVRLAGVRTAAEARDTQPAHDTTHHHRALEFEVSVETYNNNPAADDGPRYPQSQAGHRPPQLTLPPSQQPPALVAAAFTSSALASQVGLASGRRIQTPTSTLGRAAALPPTQTFSDIPVTPPSLVAASMRPEQPLGQRRDGNQPPTIVGWSTARDIDQLRRRIHVPTTPAHDNALLLPLQQHNNGREIQRAAPMAMNQPSSHALLGSSFVSYSAKLILLGKEAQEARDVIALEERQQFAEILSEGRTNFERVARAHLAQRIRVALGTVGRAEQSSRLGVMDAEASAREEILQFASVSFGRTLVLSKERGAQRAAAISRLCSEDEFVGRRTIELDEATNRAALVHNSSAVASRWKIEKALADARQRLLRESTALFLQESDQRRDIDISEGQLRDTFTVVFRGMNSRMLLLHQQEYQRKQRLAEMEDRARTCNASRELLLQNEARSRAMIEHLWAEEAADRISSRAIELGNLHRSIAEARHRDAVWQQQQDVQLREREERDVLEQQEAAMRMESLEWWQQLFQRFKLDFSAARQRQVASLRNQEVAQRQHVEALREEFLRHLSVMALRQLHCLRETAALVRELCEEETFERSIVEGMERRAFSTQQDFCMDERRVVEADLARQKDARDYRRKVERLEEFERDEREAVAVEHVTVLAELVKRCNKGVADLLQGGGGNGSGRAAPAVSSSGLQSAGPVLAVASTSPVGTRRIVSSASSPVRDMRGASLSLVREEEVNREIVSGAEFRDRAQLALLAFRSTVAALAALESSRRDDILAERHADVLASQWTLQRLHLQFAETGHRRSLIEGYMQQSKGWIASWEILLSRIAEAAQVRAQLVRELQRKQAETVANEASVRRVILIEEMQRRSVVQSTIIVATNLCRFFATEAHDRATIADFFEYERWNMTDLELSERQQILDAELSPLGSDTEDELAHDDEAGAMSVTAIHRHDAAAGDISDSSVDDPFLGDDPDECAGVTVHHALHVTRPAPPAVTVHNSLETLPNPHTETPDAVVSRGGLVVHGSSFMTQYPPPAPPSRPAWRTLAVEPPPQQLRRVPPAHLPAVSDGLHKLEGLEHESRAALELLESRMVVELLQYDAESTLAIDN